MAHERLRPQFVFDEEKIKQLKQIAPECFEDGRINFETLRQSLSDWAQDEEDKDLEHFGLFWPGKRDARRIASLPPQGTLEPIYGEGLNVDGTTDTDGVNDSQNTFIEGENLEVLKVLQKSYAGKINMIYIDPPYNTGNDFVYDDDFTEPLQEYLRRTGQVDEEGKPLTTNKRSDGRFHSKWLSMMYPRLRLARSLLREDGVIFVSIDDNEVHNLRLILNEIFGEENFVASIIWKKRSTPPNDKIIGAAHEYILLYSKEKENVKLHLRERNVEQIGRYKNPDNHKKGPWAPGDLMANVKGGRYVESLYFPIINPNTKEEHYPSSKGNWRFNKDTIRELLKNDEIYFGEDGKGKPKLKRFLSEVKDGITYTSIWDFVPLNTQGSLEMKELLGNADIFDNPKPVGLIKELLKLGSSDDSIILDFFAGSGTTAHAVLDLNRELGSHRQFICVQIQEFTSEGSGSSRGGFKTITDITKGRLKSANQSQGSNFGYKVFSLQESNYKKWSESVTGSVHELEHRLTLFSNNPLREGWTCSGLLTEILLLEGFALSSSKRKIINGPNEIFQVQDPNCEHSLLVCLDREIKNDTIEKLDITRNDIFVCLDSAVSNVDKLRLSDKGLIKTI